MKSYKGILATYGYSSITVGELKKILSAVPNNYELTWSNQFEGVNEGVGTIAVDNLSKRLYFASEGESSNDKVGLEKLWKSIVRKGWQDIVRDENNPLKDKARKALKAID